MLFICQISCNVKAKFVIPFLVFTVIQGYLHLIEFREKWGSLCLPDPPQRPLQVHDREKVRKQSSGLLASWPLSQCLQWMTRIFTWRLLLAPCRVHPTVTQPKDIEGWCKDRERPFGEIKDHVHHHQGKNVHLLARRMEPSLFSYRLMDNRVYLLVWREKRNESCFMQSSLGAPYKICHPNLRTILCREQSILFYSCRNWVFEPLTRWKETEPILEPA